MFDTKREITIMAMLGMMTVLPLQIASAASFGHNSGLHIGFGHQDGHLSYGYSGGHKRHNGAKHHQGHLGYGLTYGQRNPGYSSHGQSNNGHPKYAGTNTSYSGGVNCRETYKHQTDHNGKLTKIKGTLCYDRHGRAYIVPGSRYVDSSYH